MSLLGLAVMFAKEMGRTLHLRWKEYVDVAGVELQKKDRT